MSENESIVSPEEEKRPSILIVEDDSGIKRLMLISLRSLNYRIEAVETIEEAEELLNDQKISFDLVITDRSLIPEARDTYGYEIAKMAKEKDGQTQVIMVTGSPREVTEEIKEKYGIDEVIAKPFTLKSFADSVQSRVEKTHEEKTS